VVSCEVFIFSIPSALVEGTILRHPFCFFSFLFSAIARWFNRFLPRLQASKRSSYWFTLFPLEIRLRTPPSFPRMLVLPGSNCAPAQVVVLLFLLFSIPQILDPCSSSPSVTFVHSFHASCSFPPLLPIPSARKNAGQLELVFSGGPVLFLPLPLLLDLPPFRRVWGIPPAAARGAAPEFFFFENDQPHGSSDPFRSFPMLLLLRNRLNFFWLFLSLLPPL